MSIVTGWCLKSCIILQVKLLQVQIPMRMFAVKRLKPLSITSTKKKAVEKDFDPYFDRVDPEVMEDVRRSHDGSFEDELQNLESTYMEYKEEVRFMKEKTSRLKMIRKHFRPFIAKEMNLLTYAEKEKIRFLYKSDPEQWNAETLSKSFPISSEGVNKIIKSTFRANSDEEIKEHDEYLIEQLKKIQTGEIPLTEQLKTKLEIRNQIPIISGQSFTSNLSIPKKPLGQFGKLVAMSKPKPKEKGELVLDSGLAKRSNDLEVFKHEDPRKELRQLCIKPNDIMTLSKFENEVKSGQERTGQNLTPVVDYLLQIKEKVDLTQLIKDEPEPDVDIRGTSTDDYVNFGKIPKFKNYMNKENVEMNVERGQPYIYETKTGYQKPYADKSTYDKITIPEDIRKSGKVYQVGDSYYDSDGEFLYRVV